MRAGKRSECLCKDNSGGGLMPSLAKAAQEILEVEGFHDPKLPIAQTQRIHEWRHDSTTNRTITSWLHFPLWKERANPQILPNRSQARNDPLRRSTANNTVSNCVNR